MPGGERLRFFKAKSFHPMNPSHEGISIVLLFILYLAEGASNLLECAVYGGYAGPRVILTPMIGTRIAFQCAKTSLMKARLRFYRRKK